MKKLIITTLIAAFTTAMVSSNSKQITGKIPAANNTQVTGTNFRKDIGSAD